MEKPLRYNNGTNSQFMRELSNNVVESYLADLRDLVGKTNAATMASVAYAVVDAILQGRNVFLIGNGGSASTASHIACDIIGTCSKAGITKASVRCLSDSASVVTAIANDFGYDNIFSNQLALDGQKGDLLFFLSVSGRSKNVQNAVATAKQRGLRIVGVIGLLNENLRNQCLALLELNSADYGLVEDIGLSVGHIVARILNNNRPCQCAVELNILPGTGKSSPNDLREL